MDILGVPLELLREGGGYVLLLIIVGAQAKVLHSVATKLAESWTDRIAESKAMTKVIEGSNIVLDRLATATEQRGIAINLIAASQERLAHAFETTHEVQTNLMERLANDVALVLRTQERVKEDLQARQDQQDALLRRLESGFQDILERAQRRVK